MTGPPPASREGGPPVGPPGLDAETFRRLGYRAVDLLADRLGTLRGGPVFRPMSPAQRETLLAAPLPDQGLSPETILDTFERHVLPFPMGNGHPRFFGWVNSPPAPLGVLADLLAAGLDPSCAGGDHAAIYLERAVVRWLMELTGFPAPGSMGLLVSGGSMASLTALTAARHRALARVGWDVRGAGLAGAPRLVLYMSSEGHSCLRKAAELLGLGTDAVRVLPARDDFTFDVAALRTALAHDRAAGLIPFCVAASAGTVNTGAIDPLADLAATCRAQDLWLHVDGAYGAIGVADPDLAPRYQGLASADSLALDPHKWLSVPVECGAVLVRDGALLREAFSLVPPYLRTEEGQGFGGLPWFSEYGFQQTRGFRALKLWMTLAHLGRAGVHRLVARHRRLAAHLAGLVDAAPDLERLAPVDLSVVCFRHVPPGLAPAGLDSHNRALAAAVQAAGRVFLTATTVRGATALRACVLHHATDEADLAALVDAVREAGGPPGGPA